MKKTIFAVVLMLAICSAANAAGVTVWGLTEQVTNSDKENQITARIGYFLGNENGGIEPFIGSSWYPHYNEEGEPDPPQVLTVGGIYHFTDIVDEDAMAILSDLTLAVLADNMVISPYVGYQCTWNLADRDAGYVGGITGLRLSTRDNARASVVIEIRYDDVFGDLSAIPDNEFEAYIGLCIRL